MGVIIVVLALLANFAAIRAIKTKPQMPSKCVSLFTRQKSLYHVCKKNPCMIFRTEKPYVFLDGQMNTEMHQKPFPCRERSSRWPGLRGIFFSILDDLPPLQSAYCVWGGHDCSFDGMVHFVGNASRREEHKFIVGGLMFMLEYRISNNTIPSAPILEDRILIIGPATNRASISEAFRTVWSPFTREAWAMLVGLLAVFLLLRLWIAKHFTVPFNWRTFGANILAEHELAKSCEEDVEPNECEMCSGHVNRSGVVVGGTRNCVSCRHRSKTIIKRREQEVQIDAINNNWGRAARAAFLIIVLYYEIAVVNFIFERRSSTLLSEFDPTKFAVVKDTTQEYIFRKMMANRGIASRTTPWIRCKTHDECISIIVNPTSSMFSTSYEIFSRHMFRQYHSACKNLEIYKTDKPMPSFAGVWYMGSTIPLAERVKIDKAIVKLRENGSISKIIAHQTGTKILEHCITRQNIGILTLVLPLVLFLTPFLGYVILAMLYNTLFRRCHARPRLDEDDFKMCTVVSSDTSITAGRLSYKHHVRWKPDWSGNSSDGTLSASHRSSSASTFR